LNNVDYYKAMSDQNKSPPAGPHSDEHYDNHTAPVMTPSTASSLSHLLQDTPPHVGNKDALHNQKEEEGDEEEIDGREVEDGDDEENDEAGDDFVTIDHGDPFTFTRLFRPPPVRSRTQLDELHPFVQLLTPSNVDDCVKVEEAFPEHERCIREKVGKDTLQRNPLSERRY
jgi:hypothetical protein